MILPLASPLGSFGRPGLLVFFDSVTFSRLLYDGGSDGCLREFNRRDVQYRNVSLRINRIVRFVRPGVYAIPLRVPAQVEHFDNAIPYRLTMMYLCYQHALNVRSLELVQFVGSRCEVHPC